MGPMNNPSHRRLRFRFVLTFGMSVVFLCVVYLGVNTIAWPAVITMVQPQPGNYSLMQKAKELTFIPQQTRRPPSFSKPGWQQVTMEEVYSRFQSKTESSCIKNHKTLVCPKRLSRIRPRKNDTNWKGCTTFSYFEDLKDSFSGVEPLREPFYSDKEYIYPWEADLLSEPSLIDSKLLPDLAQSSVTLLSPSPNTTVAQCKTGGHVDFLVDLVNGYNQRRGKGMDDVRAWVKQAPDIAVTAHVTDMHNGSYLVRVTCVTPGQAKLYVGVAYPREYLRLVTNQIRLFMQRPTAVLYSKGGIKSYTVCSATPNVAYTCVCNFTDWNKQSFFCGHPSHPQLNCEDVKGLRPLWFHDPINSTAEELQLVKRMSRPASQSTIQHSIQRIEVSSANVTALPPCNRAPFNLTWTAPSPQGYWRGGSYRAYVCDNSKSAADLTRKQKCLANTNITVFGDSNGYRLFLAVTPLLSCRWVMRAAWPKMAHCRDVKQNTSVRFFPHEYPLLLHDKVDNPILRYGGMAGIIDSMPSSGRQIILGHYYLHSSKNHMTSVIARLTALRDAVVRLQKRNPDVYVGFRGPHVIYKEWDVNHAAGGDSLISQYLPIVKEVFRPIWDRMLLIDGYDMSVAIENNFIHPKGNFANEMLRFFLNYICGR